MEIVIQSLSPKVVITKPMLRTKRETIEIDETVHCSVCSREARKPVVHDNNALHSSTINSYKIMKERLENGRE